MVDEAPEEVALPLVYRLVLNKTEEAYKVILKAVKDAANQHGIPNIAPETIMSDFELAILNAAGETFPTSTIRCCFFHFGQSVYRRCNLRGCRPSTTTGL